jgi:hypothetical protein
MNVLCQDKLSCFCRGKRSGLRRMTSHACRYLLHLCYHPIRIPYLYLYILLYVLQYIIVFVIEIIIASRLNDDYLTIAVSKAKTL